MQDDALTGSIARVPAGAWAVAVSGGADSVALLSLLRSRADLSLHVVHLDHQTRGAQSAADAHFVGQLAGQWGLACTRESRDQVEAGMTRLPKNTSARYRAARLELYKRVVSGEGLNGVLLGHHADDQAETVLHRLARGSGYAGLAGMAERTSVGGLLILRPLLGVRRAALRAHLAAVEQGWREDESNASGKYFRNRLRRLLAEKPALIEAALALGEACGALRDWARNNAPILDERFLAATLASVPRVLAEQSARRWLGERGVPLEELAPEVIQHLIQMASDAASGHRRDFPGAVSVRRRSGFIFRAEDNRLS